MILDDCPHFGDGCPGDCVECHLIIRRLRSEQAKAAAQTFRDEPQPAPADPCMVENA